MSGTASEEDTQLHSVREREGERVRGERGGERGRGGERVRGGEGEGVRGRDQNQTSPYKLVLAQH